MQLTLKRAQTFGRVSDRNSKMPASTFATHTADCHVGGKLRDVEGSSATNATPPSSRRCTLASIKATPSTARQPRRWIAATQKQWAQAIAMQITRICDKFGEPYHRWFDAGDLADLAMLKAIVRVCELTPTIKHWLPTRERAILKAFLAEGLELPTNLVIRLSATMVDDKPVAMRPIPAPCTAKALPSMAKPAKPTREAIAADHAALAGIRKSRT